MTTRLVLTRLGAAILALWAVGALVPESGLARAHDQQLVATPSWSGYVATGSSSDVVEFWHATGTWSVPAAHCAASDAAAESSVWVGLGGWTPAEQSVLEHVGTDSNCTGAAKAAYYGWFEVNPYRAYAIPNTLRPGDTVTASVTVLSGARVALRLEDGTRGWAFARTISVFGQPAESAEWIVSTPERCTPTGCTLARLPDLDTVSFARIGATTNSSTGTLTDPDWQAVAVELVPGAPGEADPSAPDTSPGTPASATPGSLSADGSGFSVQSNQWPAAQGREPNSRALPAW
jgi:hypothetical protein